MSQQISSLSQEVLVNTVHKHVLRIHLHSSPDLLELGEVVPILLLHVVNHAAYVTVLRPNPPITLRSSHGK